MLRWPFWLSYNSPSYLAKIFAQPISQNLAEQKADALEHNISLFSHKMALANQKTGALEML